MDRKITYKTILVEREEFYLMEIKRDSVVLFQGDSITDAGRSYEDDSSLGTGYGMMSAAWFGAVHPELNVKFLNKGTSGNTVLNLKERWEKDCIAYKPDMVSILIGINDCWRRFDRNMPTSVEDFKADYHGILLDIKEKLGARIILCEPFLLPITEEQKKFWREDLDPKIHAVRELAREFNAIYVPFDGIFAAASMKRELTFWAYDGVHPTNAGHALMAKSWLEAVKAL